MMTTHSGHYARARRNMKFRVAAVLLLAGAVLTSAGWTGPAWGQAKLARVGILTFLANTDDPARKDWTDLFRKNLAVGFARSSPWCCPIRGGFAWR